MKAPENRDWILARYVEGPAMLERAILDLEDSDLDAPHSAGGWTIRQIVHHVVDGDDLWKMCIKLALGDEGAEFSLSWYTSQPQVVWGERWAYADRPLDVSLALLRANRAHILQLLDHIPGAWDRFAVFREPGGETEEVRVGNVVEINADHVEHHLKRILAIRREIGKDPFNLDRFVSAQQSTFEEALSQISAGEKRTHWMWFVFPQLRGLGQSETSQVYGLSGLDEARAYLWHEILGPRLIAACDAALGVEGRSAREIFGKPDDLKLKSCATLFARVSRPDSVFHKILDKYFHGEPDGRTDQLLADA